MSGRCPEQSLVSECTGRRYRAAHAAFGEPFHRWTFGRFAKGSVRVRRGREGKIVQGKYAAIHNDEGTQARSG